MPLLAVSAHDIDTAGRSLDTALPIAWLDQALADAGLHATSPGRVAVRLSRSSGSVIVRGRIEAKLMLPCARCTGPAHFTAGADLSLLLRPQPALKPAADERPAALRTTGDSTPTGAKNKKKKAREKDKETEYEFTAGEADTDAYDGETVVLDDFVREAILLEIPIFPLCSEDCPGIGPQALQAPADDVASPVDPRLAPLGALRDKIERAGHAVPDAKRSSKKTTNKE